MDGEQVLERDDVSNQLFKEAIKQDCGIRRHLYHGTSKDLAYKIIKTNEIQFGTETGYLGKGFYCYDLDEQASRLWAWEKFKPEKIAILSLVANLGNMLYINQELYQFFHNRATELKELRLEMNKRVGHIVDLFIKEIITPEYMDIHTVGRAYVYRSDTGRRPVVMFSIRNKGMIKKVEPYWEE